MLLSENLLEKFLSLLRVAKFYGSFAFSFDVYLNKFILKEKRILKFSKLRVGLCASVIFTNFVQVYIAKPNISKQVLLQCLYMLISITTLFYSQLSLFVKRRNFVCISNNFVNFEEKFIKPGNPFSCFYVSSNIPSALEYHIKYFIIEFFQDLGEILHKF